MTIKTLSMSPMLKCMMLLSLASLSSWISESNSNGIVGVVAWQQQSANRANRPQTATKSVEMALQAVPQRSVDEEETTVSRRPHMHRREVTFALMGTLWGLTAASGVANAAFEQDGTPKPLEEADQGSAGGNQRSTQRGGGRAQNPLDQVYQGENQAQQSLQQAYNGFQGSLDKVKQQATQGGGTQNPLDKVKQGANDGKQRFQAKQGGGGGKNPLEQARQAVDDSRQSVQQAKQQNDSQNPLSNPFDQQSQGAFGNNQRFQPLNQGVNALSKLPDSINKNDWSEVESTLTGPLRELVFQMDQALEVQKQPGKGRQLAKKIQQDLDSISTAANRQQSSQALKSQQQALANLKEFLSTLD